MQWLTGNIGYHHVHHLSPRVPNYKLEAVHQNTLPLHNVSAITLMTSLTSLRFRLWDAKDKKFVGYKAAYEKRRYMNTANHTISGKADLN